MNRMKQHIEEDTCHYSKVHFCCSGVTTSSFHSICCSILTSSINYCGRKNIWPFGMQDIRAPVRTV